MKRAIKTIHEVNAPINTVWELIRSGEQWEDWFDLVVGSRVEGNKRFCDIHGGDCLEESFLFNNAEHTFLYSVDKQESFPASNVRGLIRLVQNGDSATRLYWSLDLDVESDEVFSELKNQIEGMYTGGVAKLETLALQTA